MSWGTCFTRSATGRVRVYSVRDGAGASEKGYGQGGGSEGGFRPQAPRQQPEVDMPKRRPRRRVSGTHSPLTRRVARRAPALLKKKSITPNFLNFFLLATRCTEGETQGRGRAVQEPSRSKSILRKKRGTKRVFPRLNRGKLGEYSIALAYDPSRSSFQQCRSSKNQCTSAQLHRLHTGSTHK